MEKKRNKIDFLPSPDDRFQQLQSLNVIYSVYKWKRTLRKLQILHIIFM